MAKKDLKAEVKKKATNNNKKKTTLKVGSTHSQLERKKGYQKSQQIKHRGGAVNPADTFAYVANQYKSNLYIFDKEYNLGKVYSNWSSSLDYYFKTVIFRLANDGSLQSLIDKYKKKEDKVLQSYKKTFNKNGLNEEQLLKGLQDTMNVTNNKIMTAILDIKAKFNEAFGGEKIFAYSQEVIEQKINELLEPDSASQQKLAALKDALSLQVLKADILDDLEKTANGISRAEQIVSLGMGDEINAQYLTSLNNIVRLLNDPEFAQLNSDFINKFMHSGFYKDIGFYSEGSVILGALEGLESNLRDLQSDCTVTTDKTKVQTGQSKKGNLIGSVAGQQLENVVKNCFSNQKKSVRSTTNTGKESFTIDVILEWNTPGGKTQDVKLDIKSYEGHYKAGRTKQKQMNLGALIDQTENVSGDALVGRLLFANIVANKLVSSYLQNASSLDVLVYYWLMIKENGLAELLGDHKQSADFVIFGNKLVRFSDFLSSIFDPNTLIGTKTSNQVTIDYAGFSKNSETLKLKTELKSTNQWASHSEESYDLLYKDDAFSNSNKKTVESLKSQVILKQKLTVNYKNLNL